MKRSLTWEGKGSFINDVIFIFFFQPTTFGSRWRRWTTPGSDAPSSPTRARSTCPEDSAPTRTSSRPRRSSIRVTICFFLFEKIIWILIFHIVLIWNQNWRWIYDTLQSMVNIIAFGLAAPIRTKYLIQRQKKKKFANPKKFVLFFCPQNWFFWISKHFRAPKESRILGYSLPCLCIKMALHCHKTS